MTKTEREKMLAGELYVASDAALVAGRNRARRLTRLFNLTTEEELEKRQEILKELFGGMGENVYIEPTLRCDYGDNIYLGNNVFINFDCILLDCNTIHIGDNVQLATRVQLLTAYHPIKAIERNAGPELASPIRIGDSCWLGGGVIVLPGVTIGENTVIGAGSVVTKDIPANVVAVGNPCRILREIS